MERVTTVCGARAQRAAPDRGRRRSAARLLRHPNVVIARHTADRAELERSHALALSTSPLTPRPRVVTALREQIDVSFAGVELHTPLDDAIAKGDAQHCGRYSNTPSSCSVRQWVCLRPSSHRPTSLRVTRSPAPRAVRPKPRREAITTSEHDCEAVATPQRWNSSISTRASPLRSQTTFGDDIGVDGAPIPPLDVFTLVPPPDESGEAAPMASRGAFLWRMHRLGTKDMRAQRSRPRDGDARELIASCGVGERDGDDATATAGGRASTLINSLDRR